MKKLSFLLSVSVLALSLQCSKDSPAPPPSQPPTQKTTIFTPSSDDCSTLTLKGLADFPVGFAYGIGDKFNPQKNQRNTANDKNVLDNADRVTLQLFYTSQTWKGLDEATKAVTMDYIDTDREVAYAKSVGLKVFGHCLLYPLLVNGTDSNFTTPQFLLNYVAKATTTNNDIKEVLQNYLNNVLTKYKNDIEGFDLINELLGYNADGVAQSTWLRKRFNSDTEMYNFVADLFVYAKSVAGPNVKLFYNENGQENPANNFRKGNKTIEIINILKAKGGIDGYGLQLHTDTKRSIADIETAIKTAVKTGLLMHLSEMDVSVGINPPATLDAQRVKYREVVEAYKRLVPSVQQYGITLWDTNDAQSWLPGQNATLFDNIAQKKLAFYGFAEGAGAIIGTTTANGSGKIYTNTSCK
jgi:endo-1,4-beta-xylanase